MYTIHYIIIIAISKRRATVINYYYACSNNIQTTWHRTKKTDMITDDIKTRSKHTRIEKYESQISITKNNTL